MKQWQEEHSASVRNQSHKQWQNWLDMPAVLTVVASKSERLCNYWMCSMCIKDWRLMEYEAMPLPEDFPASQTSIVLSSSRSSSMRGRNLNCLTLRTKAPWSFKMSGTTFPVTWHHTSEGFSLQDYCWENQSECYLLQSQQVVMTLHCPQETEMLLSDRNITVFCQNMMRNLSYLVLSFSLTVFLVSCQLLCAPSMSKMTHITPTNALNLYKITSHPYTWTVVHTSVTNCHSQEILIHRNIKFIHPI